MLGLGGQVCACFPDICIALAVKNGPELLAQSKSAHASYTAETGLTPAETAQFQSIVLDCGIPCLSTFGESDTLLVKGAPLEMARK